MLVLRSYCSSFKRRLKHSLLAIQKILKEKLQSNIIRSKAYGDHHFNQIMLLHSTVQDDFQCTFINTFPKVKYYFRRRRCNYHLSYLKNIFLILPYQPKWYPIQIIIPWFEATALTLKMHCVLQTLLL